MKAHLTARNVPTLEAVGGRATEWWDDQLRGFYLRVSPPSTKYPQGVRAFGLFYRVRGRQFRISLGRHPVVGLAEARERAREILAAASLRGDNLGRDRGAQDLTGLMGKWLAATAGQKAAATVTEQRRIIQAYVRPSRAGATPLKHLRRAELRELVADLVKRSPVQALRVRQAVRAALRWGIAEEIIDRDPSVGWQKPAEETARIRVLHDVELAALWQACEGIRLAGAGEVLEQKAALVQVLALVAQRSGETGLMRRVDVDAGARVWLVPGRYRKGGLAHAVPLPALALQVLQPFLDAGSDLVFPAVNIADRHWIDDVRAIAAGAGLVEHWTPHDLRRTAATGMARDGTPRDVIAMILGHAVQSGGAVTGVYDRFDRLPERAAALERWAARVGGLVGAVVRG